jgi:hypothetical protein
MAAGSRDRDLDGTHTLLYWLLIPTSWGSIWLSVSSPLHSAAGTGLVRKLRGFV